MSYPVEIMDVTIRDGSYAVDFQFNQQDVRYLYPLLEQAGFRYIEIGHGFGLNASPSKGRAAATDDQYLLAAAQCRTNSRFGSFFIPGIGQRDHLKRARKEYGMDFVRLGYNADEIATVHPFVEYARELGYEVMCNLMKSYVLNPAALGKAVADLQRHGAHVVYVVDSAGGMTPAQTKDYFNAARDACDVRLGFHAHNNMELALANSMVAVDHGCTLVDCSVGGLGRSAGNTRTELMIPVLKLMGYVPEYNFLAVLQLWDHIIRPILQARFTGPVEIAGGYALVHSGQLGLIRNAAKENGLTMESVLVAMGDAVRLQREPADLERICVALRETPHASADSRQLAVSHGLLGMGNDRHKETITNSLKGIDDTLEASKALAVKAGLPLVLWTSIDSCPPEEGFMAAAYIYHDERFVVVRGLFSSVDLFAQVMAAHQDVVNIFAFDAVASETVERLGLFKDQWRGRAENLFFNSASARINFMFSTVYQVAVQHGARDILFSGIDIDKLAAIIPDHLSGFTLHAMISMPLAQEGIGFRHIGHENRFAREARDAQPLFDIAILLSMTTNAELNAIFNRLSSPSVVMDFSSFPGDVLAGLGGVDVRIMKPRLHEAVSAEFWNLLKVGRFS